MAVFTITSFAVFVNAVLAAQKLATDRGIADRARALADLVQNGKALASVLYSTGLTPVARKMEQAATAADAAFAHEGRVLDDARAIFWQVAPIAISNPDALIEGNLNPDLIIERMVSAIHASEDGPDFRGAALAERYFRAITKPALVAMLDKADFIATISVELWRRMLLDHGVQIKLLNVIRDAVAEIKDSNAELLVLVRDLHQTNETRVHQDTLIAIARKICPHVRDKAEALQALEAAIDIACKVQEQGEVGSDVDAVVDAVLRHLAELTVQGRLDEAVAEADAAVAKAQIGLYQLIEAAINQHLLAFDAEGVARQLIERARITTANPADLFQNLRSEQSIWYERGSAQGLRLDMHIAILLAKECVEQARDSHELGLARNHLGNALSELGVRGGAWRGWRRPSMLFGGL